MPTLTNKERDQLPVASIRGLVRPVNQWSEILAPLDPYDAACRIFGDLHCYTADRGTKRRDGFLGDVVQLANALQGWTALHAMAEVEPTQEPRNSDGCLNPNASDAGWIVAFCPCAVCTSRRAAK